jgi:hypothetical protein
MEYYMLASNTIWKTYVTYMHLARHYKVKESYCKEHRCGWGEPLWLPTLGDHGGVQLYALDPWTDELMDTDVLSWVRVSPGKLIARRHIHDMFFFSPPDDCILFTLRLQSLLVIKLLPFHRLTIAPPESTFYSFIYWSTIDPLKVQHGCGYRHKIIIHLQ